MDKGDRREWQSTYFEILRLNGLRVDVSLFISSHIDKEMLDLKRDAGLAAMTQFEDATINLRAFVLERPFASVETLIGLIKEHYKQEVRVENVGANSSGSIMSCDPRIL